MTLAEKHFRAVAPAYMARFISDFRDDGLWELDAFAVFGNLAHESKGLTDDQEDKPLAGKGGRNWAQWTGPRRRAFEAYCKRTGKDPDSDEAAYAYLFLELKGVEGTERGAVRKLKAATTLDDKVVAFEQGYLRAHKDYKHYDSRKRWARIAQDAFRAAALPAQPIPQPQEPPPAPEPAPTPSPAYSGIWGLAAACLTFLLNLLPKGR